MATFVGTETEFNHFLMPRICNYIQSITKPVKRSMNNICQHCGQKKELHAAHIRGRERKDIVHSLLQRYKTEDGYKVDLNRFKQEVKQAHEPVNECFLFLCQDCHRKYDNDSENAAQHSHHVDKDNVSIEKESIVVSNIYEAPSDFLRFLELREDEQNRDYVTRVFERLYDSECITNYELKRLKGMDEDSVDYRRRTFGFRRPFYVESLSERREKHTGQDRYYSKPTCGKFYLCAQWYFNESHTSYNLDKFQEWALRMFNGSKNND